ncbi:MAG TPA: hypothetical protein VER11_17290 [Polyangiaceae bacterium]|nr:hypothetical protein [Polyangiaceae bacterium]
MSAFSCAPAETQPQGVQMNKFIPDDKIASVEICRTTGEQLLKSFGNPTGQGRDGDMATLNWSSVAIVTSPDQATVGTQMIVAWVDSDGLVAGFVVNTAGIPQRPAPCREQRPGAPEEEPAPAPVKKPSEA